MTVIEVDGLTKRFGEVAAVEDLSFEVEAGEVFGFLGPNGAGKSTTINAMLDFVEAERHWTGLGRIVVDPWTVARWSTRHAAETVGG